MDINIKIGKRPGLSIKMDGHPCPDCDSNMEPIRIEQTEQHDYEILFRCPDCRAILIQELTNPN